MLNREQIAEHLREDVAEARVKVGRALLKWENSRRRDVRRPELPRSTVVWLPTGPDSDLRLLTFVVWGSRYKVPLEWLLDAVMLRFRNQRRLPRAVSPEELSLGIPAATLVCDSARAAVEERLAREFPNGENFSSRRQPPQRPMPELDGNGVDSYMRALREAAAVRPRKAARPYRRA